MEEKEIIENQEPTTEQNPAPAEPEVAEPSTDESSLAEDIGEREIMDLDDDSLKKALKENSSPKDFIKEAKEKAVKETPKPNVEDPALKQQANQQYIIDRMGNELGQFRKTFEVWQKNPQAAIDYFKAMVPAAEPTKELSPEEQFAALTENPAKFVADQLEAKRMEAVRVEQQKVAEYNQKATSLQQLAPDFSDNAMEIVRIMRDEDGLTPEQITEMSARMWDFPMDVWYHYNQRAKYNKEIAKLREENAKLKQKPGKLLNNINNATKQNIATKATGNVVDTTEEIDLSEEQVMNLSDKELKEYLKKGR